MSEGILITHLVVVGVCELDIQNYNKNVLLLHELFLICKKEGNDLHHLDQTIGLSLYSLQFLYSLHPIVQSFSNK